MNETLKTEGLAIPEALQRLPVAKQITTIDLSNPNLLARASCGSGKTMILPPYEALVRKEGNKTGCTAIRVPTKVTGTFVASGLAKFWKPMGLEVRSLNRDVSEEEAKACKEADVVVISDGSLRRLQGITDVRTYVCDEAHWLSLLAELDLAMAKARGLDIRLLSATVDPQLFLNYLGPKTGNYVLEGRSFPIRKHVIWGSPDVFARDAQDELYEIVEGAIFELASSKESAIFFLPTKKMCEDAAEKFQDHIATTFVHGGVNPADAEKWVETHAGKPFIVFATTAAATGITLDLHRSYVCDEVVESRIQYGIETQGAVRMGSNMILQAAGRAGRIREGDAYLITHRGYRDPQGGDPWLYIHPEPIIAPSTKSTPFEVVMSLASNGIVEDKDIDLLGKLEPKEILHAREWLGRNRCIESDGNLTHLGKRVAAFPMDARTAHLILSAPSKESQLALLAAFCLGSQGAYGLLKIKPGGKELAARRGADPEFELLPPHLVVKNSAPLTFAKLMQAAIQMDYGYLFKWADANNLWGKSFTIAAKDFREAGKAIAGERATKTLASIDFNSQAFQNEVHRHLKRHPNFSFNELEGDSLKGGGGFLDSAFADVFRVRGHNHCWGIAKRRTSRKGFSFWSIDFPIIEPAHMELAERDTTGMAGVE